MKKLLFALFIIHFTLSIEVIAQKRPKLSRIATWHHYRNDSLRLLWLPVKTADWLKNNQYGYRLERAEMVKGQQPVFVSIVAQPLKPQPKANWKGGNKNDNLARMAIYKDTIMAQVGEQDLTGRDEASQQNLRHLLATIAVFQSHGTAQQMGLGFVDMKTIRNKQYVYRIITNTPKNVKSDTAYISVNTNKPTAVKHPPMMGVESQEKAVVLTWPARRYVREFMMYHIERSDDGKTYKRITENPKMYSDSKSDGLFYRDSTGTNYRPYLYRLVGMNPFGEWVASDMPILGMGKDFTPPAQPVIESAKHVGGTRVTLKWTQESEGDLRGFWVSRGSSLKGDFKRLTVVPLKASETTFTDLRAAPEGTNHYVVFAVDTAGNERASLPTYVTMTDTLPPAAPKGVLASSDAKGHVTIRWNKNRETDLKGYYVYFANDPDHEFSQITRQMLTDTVFQDTITLRSLTKLVFYKVVAMDDHFNHSPFSKLYALKRPDIIAPVVPLITDVLVQDSSATIKWQQSPSNDVVAYRLYRRERGKEWVLVKTFRKAEINKREFFDASLKTSVVYEYTLDVVDESGLISDRAPIRTARALPPLFLPNPPEPDVTYIDESKENQLTWNYAAKGKYKIAIYRAEGQKGYQLLGFAYPKDSQYLDKPRQAGRYKYMMRAIHDNGKQTQWSKEVTIQTN